MINQNLRGYLNGNSFIAGFWFLGVANFILVYFTSLYTRILGVGKESFVIVLVRH